MDEDAVRARWLLSADERGNPYTGIDAGKAPGVAWTTGNRAEALVHGAEYFRRLYDLLCELDAGDWVHFTDWRGDPDQRLAGAGTEVATVLADLARKGVHVRGLVWRSHPDLMRLSESEHLSLARTVNAVGGEVLLDERVRRGGSHHQKLFLVRRPDRPAPDVGFLGGIDLCHSRNDDERHLGDPQPYDLDDAYGATPPWHDVQVQLEGPVVGDLTTTFRERWEDPTPLDHRNPYRKLLMRRVHAPAHPGPLPPPPGAPESAGPHAVQILRTYPAKSPPFPFAPLGERSIARAYRKAYERARALVYLEDQYFWSREIAATIARALEDAPELRVVVVLPRYFEQEGLVSSPPPRYGQRCAIDALRAAGGDRVAFYDLENEHGTPIYVHAKVCVIDDTWVEIGSDNVNMRSWTHDSELSCSVLDETLDGRAPEDPGGHGDGARRFARDLRLRLWREHLQTGSDDGLLDPVEGFERWRASAAALDAWHRGGRRGPRPPGRVRAHDPRRNPRWVDAVAGLAYRTLLDPDGRPRNLRRAGLF